ncbi:MAG TPA: type III pantothenate kinase, partial [Chloroflexota bacterium]|nr:type III pantothenate kinase [Chloroflexota bacterium]
MLLALDIGNTHVVGGLFDGEQIVAQWRINTVANATADELEILWSNLFAARA